MRSNNGNAIAIIGDILVDKICFTDCLPEKGGDILINNFIRKPGGSAANTARKIGASGIDVKLIGNVGKDSDGKWLLDDLKASGVDTKYVGEKGQTGFVLSIVTKDKERTMFSFRGASGEKYADTVFDSCLMDNIKVLLISGYSLINEEQAKKVLEIIRCAKKNKVIIAFDPSPLIREIPLEILDDVIGMTDIAFPNIEELRVLSGEKEKIENAISIMKNKIPCIVLKRGKNGASVYIEKHFLFGKSYEKTSISKPALKVNVRQTTGAGDSFAAGFLVSFVKEQSPEKCLDSALLFAAKQIE